MMPTTTVHYTTLPNTLGGPVAIRQGGVSRFPLLDLQGHVRQLTDSTGAVTDTFTPDAWGVEKASTGSTVNPYKPFGGWGYYRDKIERVYVRARHLRVDQGRWVSRDPIGFHGGDWVLFRYAANQPTGGVDPSGEKCFEIEVAGILDKILKNSDCKKYLEKTYGKVCLPKDANEVLSVVKVFNWENPPDECKDKNIASRTVTTLCSKNASCPTDTPVAVICLEENYFVCNWTPSKEAAQLQAEMLLHEWVHVCQCRAGWSASKQPKRPNKWENCACQALTKCGLKAYNAQAFKWHWCDEKSYMPVDCSKPEIISG